MSSVQENGGTLKQYLCFYHFEADFPTFPVIFSIQVPSTWHKNAYFNVYFWTNSPRAWPRTPLAGLRDWRCSQFRNLQKFNLHQVGQHWWRWPGPSQRRWPIRLWWYGPVRSQVNRSNADKFSCGNADQARHSDDKHAGRSDLDQKATARSGMICWRKYS